ncbi:hypothetical protein D1872_289630 [compost metagenome]
MLLQAFFVMNREPVGQIFASRENHVPVRVLHFRAQPYAMASLIYVMNVRFKQLWQRIGPLG